MPEENLPATAPIAPTPVTQSSLNVNHYKKVYAECMTAAREIAGKDATHEQIRDIASDLFNRHFDDQMDILRSRIEHSKNSALVELIQNAMMNRR